MRCIGVDLGWTSGASGLALLDRGRLVETERLLEIDAILQWIAERKADVIAVDAPMRLGNARGMRECEKEAHRLYGRYDAGCYPSSQSSPFAARTTGFAAALEALGYPHVHPHTRCQFECFPHIAAIEFFGLERIFKYKKGRRAERAAELARFRETMLDKLPLQTLPAIPATGDLKPVEDQLDAVMCAYAAWHWGRWGTRRNRLLGSLNEGCIVVPVKHSMEKERPLL